MVKKSDRSTSASSTTAGGKDADGIALLEHDHREVDGLFEAFDRSTNDRDKKAIADQICLALKVHAQLEEEQLYPAAREAISDNEFLDDALVEHMGAKTLVAQMEAMAPGQPLYDATVRVLAEQIRHHVAEEEGGLFPKLRESRLDLKKLGAKMAARKAELLALLSPPRAA